MPQRRRLNVDERRQQILAAARAAYVATHGAEIPPPDQRRSYN